MIRVIIPGKPVPAARPRVVHGHAYTPDGYARWKAYAAAVIRLAARGVTLPDGPLELVLTVTHPRPATRPQHVSPEAWATRMIVPAITRSDLDNHVKAVADALQDSGMLDNDNRIAHIVASSWYAGTSEAQGVRLALGPWTP